MSDESVSSSSSLPTIITEEGVAKPVRFFPAYPKMTNTTRLLFVAGVCVAAVLFLVGHYVFVHADLGTSFDSGRDSESSGDSAAWVPPDERIKAVNLTERTLAGLESGRMHALLFDLITQNEALMDRFGTPCATPWLEYAWKAGSAQPRNAREGTEMTNVLSIRGEARPLLNAHISEYSNETGLAVAVFKYKHARDTRSSRSASP